MSQQQPAIIRQNYSVDVENGINNQINMELTASYVYLSMVSSNLILNFEFDFDWFILAHTSS